MNDTAKKLREAADYMKSEGVASVVGDIRNTFAAIADELDKLQMKANEANNLRQQLESAEDKAERRKRHIGYLNTALHDKNGLLERRGETIARLTAESGKLRKQVPSERERQILDMWPKFEDGAYVWLGDRFGDNKGEPRKIEGITLYSHGIDLYDDEGFHKLLDHGERLKLPAQSVLDADGVEIHVGDTVYEPNGESGVVTAVHPLTSCVDLRQDDCDAYAMDAMRLTHTRPDSWERLEEDAELNDETGLVGGNLDIVRRAKALAGVEVD